MSDTANCSGESDAPQRFNWFCCVVALVLLSGLAVVGDGASAQVVAAGGGGGGRGGLKLLISGAVLGFLVW